MTTFDHPNHADANTSTVLAARDVFETRLWRLLDAVDAVFARVETSADAQRAKAVRKVEARAAADRLLLQ